MTEDSLRNTLVNLTRDLMLIQSDELHPENQKRCLQIARYRMESLEDVVLLDFEDEGHASLVALPLGLAEPDVMMVTHLDVVAHEEDEFPDPRVEDDKIIGPGAGDMKGCVAICIKVFEDLHRQHPGISLGLLITTDEEIGGHHGTKALIQKRSLRAGVVLVPDGGGPTELSIAEKGILHLKLQAVGRETHAARPWLGDNAVESLMKDCMEIKQWIEGLTAADSESVASCSITGFHSPNQSINIVPSHAEAMLDIRFPPPLHEDELLAGIQERLQEGTTLSSSVVDNPSVLNPDPAYKSTMEAVTGKDVKEVRNDGGSDGRFFSRIGIRVNMSRPRVGNIHAEDEWIDIHSMMEFYDLYTRYIKHVTRIEERSQ